MNKILIAPSILAADYLNFGRDIKKVEQAGADLLHVDVMDGCFVPNITFGMGLVKSIRTIPFRGEAYNARSDIRGTSPPRKRH